jgi:hypothetical protein
VLRSSCVVHSMASANGHDVASNGNCPPPDTYTPKNIMWVTKPITCALHAASSMAQEAVCTGHVHEQLSACPTTCACAVWLANDLLQDHWSMWFHCITCCDQAGQEVPTVQGMGPSRVRGSSCSCAKPVGYILQQHVATTWLWLTQKKTCCWPADCCAGQVRLLCQHQELGERD